MRFSNWVTMDCYRNVFLAQGTSPYRTIHNICSPSLIARSTEMVLNKKCSFFPEGYNPLSWLNYAPGCPTSSHVYYTGASINIPNGCWQWFAQGNGHLLRMITLKVDTCRDLIIGRKLWPYFCFDSNLIVIGSVSELALDCPGTRK